MDTKTTELKYEKQDICKESPHRILIRKKNSNFSIKKPDTDHLSNQS